MGGIVKLRLGNVFEGPSDLVVLPCSTAGTVTQFVSRSLVHYALPRPPSRMSHGEVDIKPFEGGENIAQFVAFAASVHAKVGIATPNAIKSIGRTLGQFTIQQSSVQSHCRSASGCWNWPTERRSGYRAARRVPEHRPIRRCAYCARPRSRCIRSLPWKPVSFERRFKPTISCVY